MRTSYRSSIYWNAFRFRCRVVTFLVVDLLVLIRFPVCTSSQLIKIFFGLRGYVADVFCGTSFRLPCKWRSAGRTTRFARRTNDCCV